MRFAALCTRAARLGLVSCVLTLGAGLVACTNESAPEQAKQKKKKKNAKDEKKLVGLDLEQVVGTPELATFALRIEDLLSQDDRIGLLQAWATTAQLSGCSLKSQGEDAPGLPTFLATGETGFADDLNESLSKNNRGPVIEVALERFDASMPGEAARSLVGEGCDSTGSGRITAYVDSAREAERVVTHVFDATFARGEWGLVGYSHEVTDCSAEDSPKKHPACAAKAAIPRDPDEAEL